MAKTRHNQPELNWIRACFDNIIRDVCRRTQQSLKIGNGSRPVASCQKPGRRFLHTGLAFRPDEFGQTLTRPSRSDPGRFCTVWSIPSLEKSVTEKDAGSRIRADSGCTLVVVAIAGRNQNASGSDPACLLGNDTKSHRILKNATCVANRTRRFETQ